MPARHQGHLYGSAPANRAHGPAHRAVQYRQPILLAPHTAPHQAGLPFPTPVLVGSGHRYSTTGCYAPSTRHLRVLAPGRPVAVHAKQRLRVGPARRCLRTLCQPVLARGTCAAEENGGQDARGEDEEGKQPGGQAHVGIGELRHRAMRARPAGEALAYAQGAVAPPVAQVHFVVARVRSTSPARGT